MKFTSKKAYYAYNDILRTHKLQSESRNTFVPAITGSGKSNRGTDTTIMDFQ